MYTLWGVSVVNATCKILFFLFCALYAMLSGPAQAAFSQVCDAKIIVPLDEGCWTPPRAQADDVALNFNSVELLPERWNPPWQINGFLDIGGVLELHWHHREGTMIRLQGDVTRNSMSLHWPKILAFLKELQRIGWRGSQFTQFQITIDATLAPGYTFWPAGYYLGEQYLGDGIFG